MNTAGFDEIVAATYAGWVVGLTTEPQQREVGPATVTATTQEPISEEGQAKIENLRCDSHVSCDALGTSSTQKHFRRT